MPFSCTTISPCQHLDLICEAQACRKAGGSPSIDSMDHPLWIDMAGGKEYPYPLYHKKPLPRDRSRTLHLSLGSVIGSVPAFRSMAHPEHHHNGCCLWITASRELLLLWHYLYYLRSAQVCLSACWSSPHKIPRFPMSLLVSGLFPFARIPALTFEPLIPQPCKL